MWDPPTVPMPAVNPTTHRAPPARLGAFRSQDTQGALEVFAGDGLGFPELGGEFIGGEGRVL